MYLNAKSDCNFQFLLVMNRNYTQPDSQTNSQFFTAFYPSYDMEREDCCPLWQGWDCKGSVWFHWEFHDKSLGISFHCPLPWELPGRQTLREDRDRGECRQCWWSRLSLCWASSQSPQSRWSAATRPRPGWRRHQQGEAGGSWWDHRGQHTGYWGQTGGARYSGTESQFSSLHPSS